MRGRLPDFSIPTPGESNHRPARAPPSSSLEIYSFPSFLLLLFSEFEFRSEIARDDLLGTVKALQRARLSPLYVHMSAC